MKITEPDSGWSTNVEIGLEEPGITKKPWLRAFLIILVIAIALSWITTPTHAGAEKAIVSIGKDFW